MAAQEYYAAHANLPAPSAPLPSQQSQQSLRPPSHGRPQSSGQQPPYPLFDGPPPPYSSGGSQRPHSQPPPNLLPLQAQQNAWQQQQQHLRPPNGYAENGYQYPPDKIPQSQHLRPHGVTPQGTPQFRPAQPYYNPGSVPAPAVQNQTYLDPNRRTTSTPVYYNRNTNNNKYSPSASSSSRSRSRSRDRDRGSSPRRHHHHSHHSNHRHDNRPLPPRKKSSGVKTFLGAGGGAIIGDAIFPGLGTLGGAILGGIGGHEYEKNSKHGRHFEKHRRYSNEMVQRQDEEYRRGRR